MNNTINDGELFVEGQIDIEAAVFHGDYMRRFDSGESKGVARPFDDDPVFRMDERRCEQLGAIRIPADERADGAQNLLVERRCLSLRVHRVEINGMKCLPGLSQILPAIDLFEGDISVDDGAGYLLLRRPDKAVLQQGTDYWRTFAHRYPAAKSGEDKAIGTISCRGIENGRPEARFNPGCPGEGLFAGGIAGQTVTIFAMDKVDIQPAADFPLESGSCRSCSPLAV